MPTPNPRHERRGQPTKVTGGWKNVLFGGRRVVSSDSFHDYGPMWKWKGWHTGEDFSASTGTPINAPLSGKVIGQTTGGPYGKSVLIQLDTGEYMRFAHMSKVAVSNGQRIKVGTYLGAVGATGNVTGAHLHLEVMTRRGDGFVDPVDFLNGQRTAATAEPGANTERTTREDPAAATSSAPASTSTTTTVINDGGWGKMAKSGFSKKDFYAALTSMFGSIDTLIELDNEARAEIGGKSIKQAIDEMVKQKITDPARARTIILETGWYKKYGEQASARLISERQRPGEFAEQTSTQKTQIDAYLQSQGVNISDDAKAALARNAYIFGWEGARLEQEIKNAAAGGADASGRKASLAAKFAEMGLQLTDAALDRIAKASWQYGWTDATLIDEVQALGDADVTYTGGAIAQGVEDITTYANDYGVKLTDADIRQYRNNFLDGLGDQPTKEALQERAAQTYTVFADQIRLGQSTRSLASAYFNAAADLLETDADAIEWDDPLFTGGKAFTTVDPKTGQQVMKGLWEFEKEIRNDSRWMTTKNARDSMIKSTTGLLNTMGLI